VASATVVTAAQLRAQGAISVADALRLVPGATVAENGQMGSLASPSIRGVKAYQVLVLVDGRRISSAAFSNPDLAKFSLADVSRIEVIRGPVSALYGSDAFGGVINIITRKPYAHGGSLTMSYGSRDRSNREISLHGADARTSWRVTTSTPTYGGDRANSDFDATNFSGSLGVSGLPGGWEATVSADSYHDTLGLPGDVVNPTPLDRQWWNRNTLDLALSRSGKDDRTDVRVYRIEQQMHNVSVSPWWASDSRFTGTTDAVEATYALTRGRHQAVMGAELRNEAFEDVEIGGTQTNSNHNTALFVQDRWAVAPGTDVVAGVRMDDHSEAGMHTTPRLGVLREVGRANLRASYAEGFRAPNFVESFGSAYATGNPNLDPEVSRQLEVGANFARKGGDLDVAVFQNTVRDMIAYVPGAVLGAKGSYSNVTRARQRGVEVAWGHRFGDVRVSTAYSYLEAKDLSADARLKRVPRHKVGVTASGTVADVQTALTARWMDGWIDVDPTTWAAMKLPGRLVLDLSLQHAAMGGATRVSPYLVVRNLTGVHYDAIAGYPGESRGVEGGVRTSW
jgi:vitamin B12 transporter